MCAMGPAVAVLLGLGLVIVSSAVFGLGYSGGSEEVEESFFKETGIDLPNTGEKCFSIIQVSE